MKLIARLDRYFYKKYNDNWDDTLFRKYILENIKDHFTILDIGAGAGVVEQMNFKGFVKQVNGLDPDPRILNNPYLDKGFVGIGDDMSIFESEKFDLIFCDNVFEHIEHPLAFLNEVNRVLKPKGLLLAKTPNKFHYMPLIAMITPTWFHKLYNKLRGREEDDTFPTLYKLNSRKNLIKYASLTGFEVIDITSIEGRPEYLRISWLSYIWGIIYERIINKLNINGMKVLLITKWRKN